MTNKWRDLIAETTDLPTMTNLDCTMCDTRTTSSVPAGTVGAFMGANYYHCGVFRPEFNCLMRNLGVPQFCAVCQRRIRQVITANFADDFGVFYRGDSDWLVWRAYTDERWHSEEIFNARHPFSTRLGAGPFITGGTEAAPTVVAGWAGYPLAVFFRGADDRLHWKVHHQGRWHGDALIEGGGPLTSDPAIMAAGPNQAAIFYRGADNWLVWREYSGGNWQGEEIFNDRHSYPTRMKGAPAVVAGWQGYRFAVFFRGEDDRLHWKAHTGDRWHSDALVEGGGPLTSDPAVIVTGPDELAVFYRGENDWLVWRAYADGQWHNEEIFNERHPYPTRMRSAPAVVGGWGGYRFAVFFRGEDDRLHWKAHTGDRWHSDALLEGGGRLTSRPGVVPFAL